MKRLGVVGVLAGIAGALYALRCLAYVVTQAVLGHSPLNPKEN